MVYINVNNLFEEDFEICLKQGNSLFKIQGQVLIQFIKQSKYNFRYFTGKNRMLLWVCDGEV